MLQFDSIRHLRALAVIIVIISHLESPFNLGAIGVDIFFVMSGFLMMMVIQHNPNPVDFAIGRVSRLVPNYWFFTILVFGLILVKPDWFINTKADFEFLIKSLLLVPFFKNPGSIHPIYTIGWTLLLEAFFYYFIFLGLIFDKITHNMRVLVISLAMVATYIVCRNLPRDYALVELLRSTVFLEVLLGMAAYQAYIAKKVTFTLTQQKYLMALAVLMLAGMGIINDETEMRILSYGIPATIVMMLFIYSEDLWRKLASPIKTVMFEIGDAGYSTYLVNLLFIFFMKKVIAVHIPFLLPSTLFGGLFAIIGCLVAGSLVHHYFDMPAYKGLRKWLIKVKNGQENANLYHKHLETPKVLHTKIL